MSSSDDTSDCECSEFGVNESYYTEKFTPAVSTSKKYRLVESVVHNDVNTLRKLLKKPSKWYQVTDKHGNNLLQLAVLRNKKEAFDYILSLDEFPLGHCNKQGLTALKMSLLCPSMRGYFAIKLIKNGAYVHKLALHDAVFSYSPEVIHLLLKKGLNPNIRSPDGSTPLHLALETHHIFVKSHCNYEIELMLLCHGADPFIEDDCGYTAFEEALDIYLGDRSEYYRFLDFFLNYTVDKFTRLGINMHLLLRLADKMPFYLVGLIDHVSRVNVDIEAARHCNQFLFSVDRKYMDMLVEKCGFLIIYILVANRHVKNLLPFTINVNISLEDLKSFVESTLKEDFVDFVSNLDSNKLFGAMIRLNLKESALIELISYLLSYGLQLNELDLLMIYQEYGYCNLFKILLLMDFQLISEDTLKLQDVTMVEKSIVPIIMYDTSFDLETYLGNLNIFPNIHGGTKKYTLRHIDLLLDYFADHRLKEICNILNNNEDLLKTRLTYYKNMKSTVTNKIEKLPQIPLLLQLARDVFRQFFIDKYEIKTSAQFFTHMNCLAINDTYKKIITFEKKLY